MLCLELARLVLEEVHLAEQVLFLLLGKQRGSIERQEFHRHTGMVLSHQLGLGEVVLVPDQACRPGISCSLLAIGFVESQAC